ncbi:MAG TPA: hypothetical protein VEB86_05140 [Chryseosolibacter sp.]|nr:hypothetical protein [Chryseosolibacter sp.]
MKFYLCSALLWISALAYGKTSAVIEESRLELVVSSPLSLVVREYTRITILSEEGYEHAVWQNYYDSFRRIRSLKYSILDAAGKRIKKLTKADALDILWNPSYEVGDARVVILDPQYKSFPFTAEIEAEITYNGFISFPVWMPRFAHGVEVKKARLMLQAYPGFEFRSQELNGVKAAEVTSGATLNTHIWKLDSLPALSHHASYKAFYASQPRVHLTPVEFSLEDRVGNYKSWANFGDWFFDLNKGRNTLPESTRTFVDGLKGKHAANPSGLVKEAYQYMQGKTRYVSIQLGIGGFQSIPANEVERTGYGDCKALTNYMKAMLDYAGISSNYVLVHAGADAADVIADFPSNQFNHVFLAVPLASDTLWLECTSQTVPAGYIGTFTDDRNVLWIAPGQSKVIRTPVYDAAASTKTSECQVVLEETGNATLEYKISQGGQYFEEFMRYKGSLPENLEKFNYAKFSFNDFTIKSFEFSAGETPDPSLDLKFNIAARGIGKISGNRMILSLTFLQGIDKEVEYDPANRHCEVRRGFTLRDRVEVTIPEPYRVGFIPDEISETSEFGSVRMKVIAKEGNKVHFEREAILRKGNFTNELFDRFYEFYKKIRSTEQLRMMLQSKT